MRVWKDIQVCHNATLISFSDVELPHGNGAFHDLSIARHCCSRLLSREPIQTSSLEKIKESRCSRDGASHTELPCSEPRRSPEEPGIRKNSKVQLRPLREPSKVICVQLRAGKSTTRRALRAFAMPTLEFAALRAFVGEDLVYWMEGTIVREAEQRAHYLTDTLGCG